MKHFALPEKKEKKNNERKIITQDFRTSYQLFIKTFLFQSYVEFSLRTRNK